MNFYIFYNYIDNLTVWCCFLFTISYTSCQNSFGNYPDPYNYRNNEGHNRPNPGDPNYRTYEYQGRRYGQSSFDFDSRNSDNQNDWNYLNFNPNYPGFGTNDPRFRHPVSNLQIYY